MLRNYYIYKQPLRPGNENILIVQMETGRRINGGGIEHTTVMLKEIIYINGRLYCRSSTIKTQNEL